MDWSLTGYRHITLRDNEGEELPNSVLLVHVAVTNKRGGGKPKKRGMSVKRKATKLQTGLKVVGVKALDDLFKVPLLALTGRRSVQPNFRARPFP